MADLNRLRNAAPVSQADDDPFADLARVMGFDPREPFSKPQAQQSPIAATPAPRQISAPATAAEADDFDLAIDLEGELMGAFNEPEHPTYEVDVPGRATAPQAVYVSQPSFATQPRYAPELPPAHSRSAESDFASLDEEAYAIADEPGHSAREFSSGSDYRHVAATEYQPPIAGDEEFGAFATAEAYEASDGSVYDETQKAAQYAAPSSDIDAYDDVRGEQSEEDFLAFELDEALSDSLEAQDEPDLPASPEDRFAVMQQAAELPAASPENTAMDRSFDTAMAEVDMDFTEDPEASRWQPAIAAEPHEEAPEEPLAHASTASYAADADVWESQQDKDLDQLDDELGDLMAREMSPSSDQDDGSSLPEEYPPASPHEIDDAIAELAKMVRGYERPEPVQPTPVFASTESDAEEEFVDFDTVEVPEGAVALADELDIPDVSYAEEPAPMFDDLDAELAATFGDAGMERVQPAHADEAPAPDFDLGFGYQTAAVAGAATAYGASRAADQHSVPQQAYHDDFEVERDFEDELLLDEMPALAAERSPFRNYLMAAIVGGVVIVGGIGAYALSGNGAVSSGEPALVKADIEPIKVKPANPGGTTVPNQQSQVFNKAVGAPVDAPTQDALVKTTEEPVDMAERFPEELPQPVDETADIGDLEEGAPKSEDRIDQAMADQPGQPAEETVAVQPRKVRTMIVKPDGSLVAREEPIAADNVPVGSTTASEALTNQTESAKPQDVVPTPTNETTDGIPAKPAAATQTAMPDSVPVAPSRPADQPVDVVGEVKPDQVAAVAPTAAAPGLWSMQIASQPTEAAAQSTYKDLSRRYAGVLGGKQANIVKAEIAGKGTFWRVRVPAGGRNEAISLCESYKSAGGNCFVSK